MLKIKRLSILLFTIFCVYSLMIDFNAKETQNLQIPRHSNFKSSEERPPLPGESNATKARVSISKEPEFNSYSIANLASQDAKGMDVEFVGLKNSILSIPFHSDWSFRSKKLDIIEKIASDEVQTKKIFLVFSDFESLVRVFGTEQAVARVKMIEFFDFAAKNNLDALCETLKSIKEEDAFKKNIKSRQSDYRDLVKIYFKNISTKELKSSLQNILTQIQYDSSLLPFIGPAISLTHPELVYDEEFRQSVDILWSKI